MSSFPLANLPAFCPPTLCRPSLSRPATSLHSLRPLRPICPASSRRPSTRPLHVPVRASVTLPGNIMDLPLEPIPHDGSPLPPYWSRPGVYGVYSSDGTLQYVAAVEDVAQALRSHVHFVTDPDRVHGVRMITTNSVDETPLGQMAENWVLALHQSNLPVPPGNSDVAPEWRQELQPVDVSFSGAIPAGDADARVEAEIKTILKSYDTVLFMKGTRAMPQCGFSKFVVDVLERQVGDAFVCINCLDANKNPGLREGIKKFSNWPTIPQLYVKGDFVGGADIIQEMEANGELVAVLNS